MTIFGPVTDVRPLFPRERRALLDLLDGLAPEDWSRPTVCPGWDVHDVVAHVLNDYMRRLSGSRDGYGRAVFAADETLPAYLARVNGQFAEALRQISPQVMIDLLGHLGGQLDDLWAARDLGGPADLDVSWAATDVGSPAWLDIGREYTEFWVHQQQVRDAVSAPGADDPALMGPVLDLFARALPYTLRDEERPEGTTVTLEVTGLAGGRWSATRREGRWRMSPAGAEPAARVSMDQDTFWRLATRGVTPEQARERADMAGDPALAMSVTTLLAIVA
ncbi:maleylpyruvate isomerase family mycothiol-dependent enzyme [Nonomuraea deserti]|uniref:Maleylpyruvate isomerase family mycothiol-dependent enzyme n=1 Tax=Nonomuraea deserti TaxID=1848322 RepID=A0A4R4VBF7_9ACTN|nr:maleylpyruvate isomerase family mycothiol-dependent enzyme [Nonomuraea deserti]TDC99822.1 maleylpyruvate isomerase family mycothiol-dependent enzyme [Nonomuraea deserti]